MKSTIGILTLLISFIFCLNSNAQLPYLLDSIISVGIIQPNHLNHSQAYYLYDSKGRQTCLETSVGYGTKTYYYQNKIRIDRFFMDTLVGHRENHLNSDGFIIRTEDYNSANNVEELFSVIEISRRNDNQVMQESEFAISDNEKILSKESIYTYNSDNSINSLETRYFYDNNFDVSYKYKYIYNEAGDYLRTSSKSENSHETNSTKDTSYYAYKDGILDRIRTRYYFDDQLDYCTLNEYEYTDDKIQDRYYFSDDCINYSPFTRQERELSDSPYFQYQDYKYFTYPFNTEKEHIQYAESKNYVDVSGDGNVFQIQTRTKNFGLNGFISSTSVSKRYYRLFELPLDLTDDEIEISIYPNPALSQNPINIITEHAEFDAYAIFSADGRLLKMSPTFTPSFQFIAPEIPGIYNLALIKDNKLISYAKSFVVIEN